MAHRAKFVAVERADQNWPRLLQIDVADDQDQALIGIVAQQAGEVGQAVDRVGDVHSDGGVRVAVPVGFFSLGHGRSMRDAPRRGPS